MSNLTESSDDFRLTSASVAGVYNLTTTGAGAYTVDAANLFRVVESDSSLTDLYADVVAAEVKVQVSLPSLDY